MKQEERLSGALQENILVVLAFDDLNCRMVRAAITPQLFESSVFREVAGHAIDFIDQYGEAIKDHLPDHLEDILKGADARKASSYQRLLENLFLSRDAVNGAYVISQLHKFVRMQTFKSGLVQAVEAVEDGRLEAAEVVMQKAMSNQAVAFEPGLDLSKRESLAAIFDSPEEEGFTLGIPEFDDRGIIPRRKELYALMAPRKKGKSWFLTHVAKRALLQRWSVAVVTLELGEKAYGGRLLQSFFSLSRREATVKVTRFVRDKDGGLEGMIEEQISRLSLSDPAAREKLIGRAQKEFSRRKGFRIKNFPMNSLTLDQLEAYLDGLERFEGFTPDVIVVDYPRIMKHDAKNLRIELGQTIAGIRGIAGKRNAAAVIVHQGNRSTENATHVSAQDAEEDISLVASSDVVVTYSQTPAEYKLGLARLHAEYVRNSVSDIHVLITQSYALGQFCLDSVPLNAEYWPLIEAKEERDGRRRRRPDDEEEEAAPQRRRRIGKD